jgi:hypothetical protein
MTEQSILERLDALVQLSVPAMTEVEKETDETRVLRLCDYAHTREEIAKGMGKSLNRIDVVLNSLRKVGRIRSLPKDGMTVYVRLRR